MVTTRSQGAAEASGILPLRSRNLAETSTPPRARIRTVAGGKHQSVVPNHREHFTASPAADHERRSSLVDRASDAVREMLASAIEDQETAIAPDPGQEGTAPQVSTPNDLEADPWHSTIADASLPLDENQFDTSKIQTRHDSAIVLSNNEETATGASETQLPSAHAIYESVNITPRPVDASSTDDTTYHFRAHEPDTIRQGHEPTTGWDPSRARAISMLRGTAGRLSQFHTSRARQPSRSSIVKQHRHATAQRTRHSLQQFKAQNIAHGRRTSLWAGQKSRFIVGH